MNSNSINKRVGSKVERSEEPVVGSVTVQAALARFIEYHPPNRFSRNLRKMLLEFLLTQGGDEGVYFKDLLYDLEGLFELLDVIEDVKSE